EESDRMVGPCGRSPPAGFGVTLAAYRRRLGRGRGRGRISAADPDPFSVHWLAGGFRLSVPGGVDRRSHYGKSRAAGQIVHPTTVRVRLRGTGRDGHPHH